MDIATPMSSFPTSFVFSRSAFCCRWLRAFSSSWCPVRIDRFILPLIFSSRDVGERSTRQDLACSLLSSFCRICLINFMEDLSNNATDRESTAHFPVCPIMRFSVLSVQSECVIGTFPICTMQSIQWAHAIFQIFQIIERLGQCLSISKQMQILQSWVVFRYHKFIHILFKIQQKSVNTNCIQSQKLSYQLM